MDAQAVFILMGFRVFQPHHPRLTASATSDVLRCELHETHRLCQLRRVEQQGCRLREKWVPGNGSWMNQQRVCVCVSHPVSKGHQQVSHSKCVLSMKNIENR